MLPVYDRPEFVLHHGKGSYVWDTDGNKYLDFSAGIAVNALGHADEGVLKVCVCFTWLLEFLLSPFISYLIFLVFVLLVYRRFVFSFFGALGQSTRQMTWSIRFRARIGCKGFIFISYLHFMLSFAISFSINFILGKISGSILFYIFLFTVGLHLPGLRELVHPGFECALVGQPPTSVYLYLSPVRVPSIVHGHKVYPAFFEFLSPIKIDLT